MLVNIIEFMLVLGIIIVKFILPSIAIGYTIKWLIHRYLWIKWFSL